MSGANVSNGAALNPRTRRLLEDPLIPPLIRLAIPKRVSATSGHSDS